MLKRHETGDAINAFLCECIEKGQVTVENQNKISKEKTSISIKKNTYKGFH